jgi:hypothetical protein
VSMTGQSLPTEQHPQHNTALNATEQTCAHPNAQEASTRNAQRTLASRRIVSPVSDMQFSFCSTKEHI